MASLDSIHPLTQDLRYALRQMRRAPGFALITILTLALGVGAAAAVFSVMDAMLIRPLPFDHPERILVTQTRSESGYTQPFSLPDFKDLRGSLTNTLDAFAGFDTSLASLQTPAGPESMNAVRGTDNFFRVFGVAPMLGRTFVRGEDEAGHDDVVVLSYETWRNYFGADGSIVGKTIRLDGRPTVVLGVMPAGFRFPLQVRNAVYTPLHGDRHPGANSRGSHWLPAVARMNPGVTEQQALAELATRMAALSKTYPDADAGRRAGYRTLSEYTLGKTTGALWALIGAVAALLLIACVNVAGLLLARAVKRQREVALRSAVGAGRSRLLRQFLTESASLGVISGGLGILLGYGLLRAMRSYLIVSLSRGADVHMNLPVLFASLLAAIVTAFAASLLPSLMLSRPDLNRMLKTGGGTGAQRSQTRVRAAFMVAQVSLSLVLLLIAGLLLRVLQRSEHVELGFDAAHILTMELNLPQGSYAGRDPIANFYQPLLDRLERTPGVLGAGVITLVPIQASGSNMDTHIAGQPPYPKNVEMLSEVRLVSEGYFRAMGIPLRQGRLLTPSLDRASEQEPHIVVNQAFVHKFFPGGGDPIGARIDDNDAAAKKTRIVGITADVRQELTAPPMAELEWLIDSVPMKERLGNLGSMSLVLRSAGDPADMVPVVRAALHDVDATVPMREAKSMRTVVEDQLVFERMESLLFSTFAVLAVLLAMAGMYGLVSQEVEAGTRDTGVRMALGATRAHVIRRVLGRVTALVSIGSVLGIALAVLSRRFLQSVVPAESSGDGWLLLATPCAITLLGILAAAVPGRRAANIDPVQALRAE